MDQWTLEAWNMLHFSAAHWRFPFASAFQKGGKKDIPSKWKFYHSRSEDNHKALAAKELWLCHSNKKNEEIKRKKSYSVRQTPRQFSHLEFKPFTSIFTQSPSRAVSLLMFCFFSLLLKPSMLFKSWRPDVKELFCRPSGGQSGHVETWQRDTTYWLSHSVKLQSSAYTMAEEVGEIEAEAEPTKSKKLSSLERIELWEQTID